VREEALALIENRIKVKEKDVMVSGKLHAPFITLRNEVIDVFEDDFAYYYDKFDVLNERTMARIIGNLFRKEGLIYKAVSLREMEYAVDEEQFLSNRL